VLLFFSNSNIDTAEEFARRLEAAEKLAAAEGVELVADAYDHRDWLERAAAGHELDREKGGRCRRCFAYNLARTAASARAHGCDAFTTSLSVSPHKVSEMIFAASDDDMFLREDFKKRGGFQLSVRRSKELGLYRQSYCGCEFSKLSWGQAPK
jgi:predicted adenine nucleotide alpha hydrolase (AANH) superfamily ATPase